jgi:hypothetical protein
MHNTIQSIDRIPRHTLTSSRLVTLPVYKLRNTGEKPTMKVCHMLFNSFHDILAKHEEKRINLATESL